jgi:hypothetical protein
MWHDRLLAQLRQFDVKMAPIKLNTSAPPYLWHMERGCPLRIWLTVGPLVLISYIRATPPYWLTVSKISLLVRHHTVRQTGSSSLEKCKILLVPLDGSNVAILELSLNPMDLASASLPAEGTFQTDGIWRNVNSSQTDFVVSNSRMINVYWAGKARGKKRLWSHLKYQNVPKGTVGNLWNPKSG